MCFNTSNEHSCVICGREEDMHLGRKAVEIIFGSDRLFIYFLNVNKEIKKELEDRRSTTISHIHAHYHPTSHSA